MMKVLAAVILTACLAGCQVLGVPVADTFNKKWAEAEQTDTTALASALTLAQAGKITPLELRQVEAQTDNIKSGLDLVRSLHATNPTAAGDRLSELIATLGTLAATLQQKEGT